MYIRFEFHGEHDLRVAVLGKRRAFGEHIQRVRGAVWTCREMIDEICEYHGITPEYNVTITVVVAAKEIAPDVRIPEACFSETVRARGDPDIMRVLMKSNVWVTLVLNDHARSMPNSHPQEHARSIRKSYSLEHFALVACDILGFLRWSEVIVTAEGMPVRTQYEWGQVNNHWRVAVRLAGEIRPDFPPPDPEHLIKRVH